jgi:hypothetical protein
MRSAIFDPDLNNYFRGSPQAAGRNPMPNGEITSYRLTYDYQSAMSVAGSARFSNLATVAHRTANHALCRAPIARVPLSSVIVLDETSGFPAHFVLTTPGVSQACFTICLPGRSVRANVQSQRTSSPFHSSSPLVDAGCDTAFGARSTAFESSWWKSSTLTLLLYPTPTFRRFVTFAGRLGAGSASSKLG